MVGGVTSQIGYIHRSAMLRDNTFTLLAGHLILMPEAVRHLALNVVEGLPKKTVGHLVFLRGKR